MTYLHNLGLTFEAIAQSNTTLDALRFPDGTIISYGDLNTHSNRIAHALIARGLKRRDVLAMFNSKSVHGFATMLAALKIGAAYVNLDDQNPVARLRAIIESCRPRLIGSDFALRPDLLEMCSELRMDPIRLDLLAAENAIATTCPTQVVEVLGSDPAYIMFTSGSTGIPKGAMIAHHSVLNLAQWAQEQYSIGSGDVLTNVNPVYFDNSVFDFYAALFNRAAMAPMHRDLVKQPRQLVTAVEQTGCTLWFSVPSMLIYLTTLRQISKHTWPAMRCIAFGGEGYPKSELAKLHALVGDRIQLVNVYGPTECTCICSAWVLTAEDLLDTVGLPPIGHLARNFDYLLLDHEDRPVPQGEAGELCLLGPQVGLGYCNDAARTAQSFARNPLNSAFHETMYRTGDLLRHDDQGRLWFVGRKDNQIKHMGYRIELEEIEAALDALPGVIQAAAVYKRVREQHGEIVAFVAMETDAMSKEDDLRAGLRRMLPDYMVPGRVLIMQQLPKNANGKVDRKALLASLS